MEKWQHESIGSVCDILDNRRKPITKKDRIPGPYPYYGASGILDHVDGYLFDEPLVLVGEDGAKWGAGDNTAFPIDGKCWVNNHAHVLRPNPNTLLDDWLIYYLNASDLSHFITGLTVPKLNQGNLREIPIPIPPLPEQHRIVAILDEAFAAIATASANAEKNLANARELFESYLDDIFISHDNSWEEKAIGDFAELIDSLHKTPSYIKKGGFPMVRVTDIKNGFLDLGNARRVDEATFREFSKRHKANVGDLVLSRVGSYGIPAVVNTDAPFCLGQNTVFIVPKINPKLLYYFLLSRGAKTQIDKFVTGSTQPTISLKSIKQIVMPIPKTFMQDLILSNLDKASASTKKMEILFHQKLSLLSELKQSILHKAFTGELTANPKAVDRTLAEAGV